MRMFSVVAVLGLAVSCGAPAPVVEQKTIVRCGAETCSGCCSEGRCEQGTTSLSCGSGGNACGACAADQLCGGGVCAAKPMPSKPKRIFLTRSYFDGNLKLAGDGLDGLSGGDNLCARAATSVNLGGNWKAWLSTSTVDAIDRIQEAGPWVDLRTSLRSSSVSSSDPSVPLILPMRRFAKRTQSRAHSLFNALLKDCDAKRSSSFSLDRGTRQARIDRSPAARRARLSGLRGAPATGAAAGAANRRGGTHSHRRSGTGSEGSRQRHSLG